MKPVAYEGTEPYLFVSYAHRDSDEVFEVLDELAQRGYRLWYDDGIAPGSEWPEDIAQHLDGAATVISFVTENSMASRNCRREINFALSREKPFLSIVLRPTEMPLGMEMQLSAQQSILRYNYETWDGFIAKVLRCPDLAPCQGPVPEPVAEPTDVPAPADDALVPQEPVVHEVVAHEPERPAPQPVEAVVETVPPADSPAHIKAAAADQKPAARAGLPKVVLIAVVALALVGAGVLFALTRGPKKTALSWGSEISASDTAVYATGKTLTAEDWDAIGSLVDLRTLKLEGCDLSACDFAAAVEQGEFAALRKLDLSGTTGITDFSFLAKLPLTEVDLSGCANFGDLTQLDLSGLSTLDVSGTQVSDLAPLAEVSLTTLSFADTAVASIEPLAGMAELEVVKGARTQVSDLTPLAGLEKLEHIDFDGCALGKLPSSLAALSLAKVHLAGTGISKLGMLANCTRLTELDVSKNSQLKSTSWLDAQNCATLTDVNLAQTGLAADGISWITQCSGLQTLHLDGISLADLSLCAGLDNLETLTAVGCGIKDITGLEGCTKLEIAVLANNKIEDATPLQAMSLSHDAIVDLTNNALTSVDGLADGDYRALLLYGNDQDIALTVRAAFDSYVLVVPWCESFDKTAMATEGYHGKLFVVDCPDNQQLKTKDALKGLAVTFVTADELWDLYESDGFGYSLDIDYSYFLSLVNGSDMPSVTPTISL